MGMNRARFSKGYRKKTRRLARRLARKTGRAALRLARRVDGREARMLWGAPGSDQSALADPTTLDSPDPELTGDA